MRRNLVLAIGAIFIFSACKNHETNKEEKAQKDSTASAEMKVVGSTDDLPAPYSTKSVTKESKVIGWAAQRPTAPAGFTVSKFADSLQHPRWIYVADNGDIFVSQGNKEKSPNNILLFRDKNKDGIYETKSVYLSGLEHALWNAYPSR